MWAMIEKFRIREESVDIRPDESRGQGGRLPPEAEA